MGKPKRKKAAPAATAALAAAGELTEASLFEPDGETTNSGKNAALARLLATSWSQLALVRAERIEIGASGWRAVFRE